MAVRKLLKDVWEFVSTISVAIIFSAVGLGALIVVGLILASPIVVIALIYQHLL